MELFILLYAAITNVISDRVECIHYLELNRTELNHPISSMATITTSFRGSSHLRTDLVSDRQNHHRSCICCNEKDDEKKCIPHCPVDWRQQQQGSGHGNVEGIVDG